MKQEIHPKWFAEARVTCACGNTWTTGATQAELRTDICSACHPFFTGEQRIVDTEGQVDRFLKRLQVRDSIRGEVEAREAAKTPMDLPLARLGLDKRAVAALKDNGMEIVSQALERLADGEAAFAELTGVGQKGLADIKKALRARGYELPNAEEA
jgi:large subunit ribosomal protein L31